jgi:branched-chain amino acid transport system permease protein
MIAPFLTEGFQANVAINVTLALGLYVMVATGQLSLGQSGFMAVGAYASAWATVETGWPLLASIIVACLAAGAVALPVAVGANRVRGIYLIVGTLAVGQVMVTALGTFDALGGRGGQFVPIDVSPAGIFMAAGIVLVGLLALERTRLGPLTRAIRSDEEAASALGVNTRLLKVGAVVLGAAITGLAGALYAHYFGFIRPDRFGVLRSFDVALFVLIGGSNHLLGPVAGAFLLTYLPMVFRPLLEYRGLAYGLLLIATMAFSDRGLVTRRRVAVVARWLGSAVRQRGRPPGEGREGAPATGRADAAPPLESIRTRSSVPRREAPVLLVSDLHKRFSGLVALDGVDLSVHGGEILGLIGPNGAGKTTLINVATGLISATRGTVSLRGENITGLSPHQRARRGMARTFQAVRLFHELTVEENVALGAPRSHGHAQALQALGIGPAGARMPHTLPYGTQRRVQIAQAMAARPSVLFFDEPSIGLDPDQLQALAAIVASIRDAGTAVVLVDHNLDMVVGLADRIAVLDFGRKIADGPPGAVLEDEGVQRAYLGAPALPEDPSPPPGSP